MKASDSSHPSEAAEDALEDRPVQGARQKKCGTVSMAELTRELRHKYLTILKRSYWDSFEEGQCLADSVIVLNESADRCCDDEAMQFQDWEFIQSYLISNKVL